MILSQMAVPFQGLQIPVEIALWSLLMLMLLVQTLTRLEYALLATLFAVTALSLPFSSTAVFSVNAKQNFLAVFSLIYFSKVSYRSRIIEPTFAATSILLILGRCVPSFAVLFSKLALDTAYNLSRFGGLFFNTHFNAFFMSSVLIAYGPNPIVVLVGSMLAYLTASKFVFFAYVANEVSRWAWPFMRRHTAIIFMLAVVGLLAFLIAYLNAESLIVRLTERGDNSVAVIAAQVFDPAYYRYLLNLIPGSHYYIAEPRYPFPLHDGHNEIGYFALALQSGSILGSMYLIALVRRAPKFAVFILVSLSHNLFILSPLMIYMFVQFGSAAPIKAKLKTPK